MGGRLDDSIAFEPIGLGVLTVSDSRSLDDDKSGDLLAGRIEASGHVLVGRSLVADDIEAIRSAIRTWVLDARIDAIITTGGTGVTGRDVTPEALRGLFDKEIEGFGEMFRWLSFAKIGTSALQSRAVGGVFGGVYIFALPGAPSACRDGWDEILRWQLDIRHRPCNFVELMPRLNERGSSGGKR